MHADKFREALRLTLLEATPRLSHPNTVAVFDYGRAADGTFYYVMERLDGVCVSELLKEEQTAPPERIVHLLRQLCGALAEAHAAELIHRDIKPGNVMLCRQGGTLDVAKLMDFGLVRVSRVASGLPDTAKAALFFGTPQYASPEQFQMTTVDRSSDLYSLGVMTFHLIARRLPFEMKSLDELAQAHRRVLPPYFAELGIECPSELEAIVRRCLAKLPSDRFDSAVDLELALVEVGTNLPRWTQIEARKWWSRIPARNDLKFDVVTPGQVDLETE